MWRIAQDAKNGTIKNVKEYHTMYLKISIVNIISAPSVHNVSLVCTN